MWGTDLFVVFQSLFMISLFLHLAACFSHTFLAKGITHCCRGILLCPSFHGHRLLCSHLQECAAELCDTQKLHLLFTPRFLMSSRGLLSLLPCPFVFTLFPSKTFKLSFPACPSSLPKSFCFTSTVQTSPSSSSQFSFTHTFH